MRCAFFFFGLLSEHRSCWPSPVVKMVGKIATTSTCNWICMHASCCCCCYRCGCSPSQKSGDPNRKLALATWLAIRCHYRRTNKFDWIDECKRPNTMYAVMLYPKSKYPYGAHIFTLNSEIKIKEIDEKRRREKKQGKSRTKNTPCANENLFVTEIYVGWTTPNFRAFFFRPIFLLFSLHWPVFLWALGGSWQSRNRCDCSGRHATASVRYSCFIKMHARTRAAHTPTMTSARFVQLSANSNLKFRKLSVSWNVSFFQFSYCNATKRI